MRAAVFKVGDRKLTLANLPDPSPGPGEVVVRVARCGICGSDLHLAEGHTLSFDDGAVPGHEVSGEVVAKGRDTEGLAIGDRVAVMPYRSCGCCVACRSGDPSGCTRGSIMGTAGVHGGFAEYVLTNAIWCVKLPQSLGFEDGALIEPLAVSLRATRVARLSSGDRVLVLGAGAIGLAAVYWARRQGASKVVVAATSTRRKSFAFAMGADDFLVADPEKPLAIQATEALGAQADIVFECAGSPGSLDLAVDAVRRRGVISAPGFCWEPDRFSPLYASIKEATIHFTSVYERREFEIAAETMDRGHVEPRAMITEVVDLKNAPDAFERLRVPNDQCKVMINPNA